MGDERIKMKLGDVLTVAIVSIQNGKVENALGVLKDLQAQLARMEANEGNENRIVVVPGGMKHG